MQIKKEILNILQNIIFFIKEIVISILLYIVSIINKIEISDLVGISLIFLAIILILRRARMRIFQSFNQLNDCPKCGHDLHRKHRTIKQKILSQVLYAKVMHYSCNKCNYHGLHIKKFK